MLVLVRNSTPAYATSPHEALIALASRATVKGYSPLSLLMPTALIRAVSCLVFVSLLTPTVAFARTPIEVTKKAVTSAAVYVESVSAEEITGSFENLPADSQIVLVDYYTRERSDLVGSTYIRSAGSGKFTLTIKQDHQGAKVSSLYLLRAQPYSAPGTVLAETQSFQTHTKAADAPTCTASANAYAVAEGKSATISWKSRGATSAYAMMGFPSSVKKLPVIGSKKVTQKSSGTYLYSVVFNAPSGNQAICSTYVRVGAAVSGAFSADEYEFESFTPTLTGSAKGATSVVVEMKSVDADEDWAGETKIVPVTNGKWSVALTEPLPYNNTEYDLTLNAVSAGKYTKLDTATMWVEVEGDQDDLYIELVDAQATVTELSPVANSYGTFTIKFDLTASDTDLYIPATVGTKNDPGFEVRLGSVKSNNPATMNSGVIAATVYSTASKSSNHFVLPEGETETFTVTATLNPVETGDYLMHLDVVNYKKSIQGGVISFFPGQESIGFQTPTVRIPDAVTYSGAINKSSLQATTYTPTITGTAKGTTTVRVIVDEDGVGMFDKRNVPVVNGAWSVKVTPALTPQTNPYQVLLLIGDTELAEGALTVRVATTTPSVTRDTYRGYLNERLFITTPSITEADALANCKTNAASNPTSAIRCTWGTKEIYRSVVITAPQTTPVVAPKGEPIVNPIKGRTDSQTASAKNAFSSFWSLFFN